jgi:ComF family protein
MGAPFSIDPGGELVSAEAIADPPPFRRLRFPVLYNDEARRLVAGLKYGDRLELAPWLARWMAASGSELTRDCSVVVPVPLHRSRLAARRFNQSAELARNLARAGGLEYAPAALERVRKTRQQVGLGRDARSRNVQGAFTVPADKRTLVEGRQVLLIDDVYTSGATVKSAVRALKRAGASDVDVLCFARVETGELKALYNGN